MKQGSLMSWASAERKVVFYMTKHFSCTRVAKLDKRNVNDNSAYCILFLRPFQYRIFCFPLSAKYVTKYQVRHCLMSTYIFRHLFIYIHFILSNVYSAQYIKQIMASYMKIVNGLLHELKAPYLVYLGKTFNQVAIDACLYDLLYFV